MFFYERKLATGGLDSLHVLDGAGDVARESAQAPARQPVGVASFDAADRFEQTGALLCAAWPVLVNVPGGNFDASKRRPAFDSFALNLG